MHTVKTRRGKKKNRKFLTKIHSTKDSLASYPQVTTIINIEGKDYHGQVNSLNCNLGNTSDVSRIANNVCLYNQRLLAGICNHDKHSNIASIDVVTAGVISLTHNGITSYDEDIHLAQTNELCHYHGNHFNGTEPLHNGEDSLAFLKKESGK